MLIFSYTIFVEVLLFTVFVKSSKQLYLAIFTSLRNLALLFLYKINFSWVGLRTKICQFLIFSFRKWAREGSHNESGERGTFTNGLDWVMKALSVICMDLVMKTASLFLDKERLCVYISSSAF